MEWWGPEQLLTACTTQRLSTRLVRAQDYTATVVKQDKDSLAISLRTAYAADMLKFTGTFTQAGKVRVLSRLACSSGVSEPY